MFNDKGFIKFKDGDFEVTINYIHLNDQLFGITEGSSYKVKYFSEHPNVTAADGIKSDDFVNVRVKIEDNEVLAREIWDEMTTLHHNHFKEYSHELVPVKIQLLD